MKVQVAGDARRQHNMRAIDKKYNNEERNEFVAEKYQN